MNFKNMFQKAKPKKIQATTRRATMPIAEDYDSDEPNVRLSRAFFVVMLLHVVAVGGIFAFSSLKKNSQSGIEPTLAEETVQPAQLSGDSRLYVVAPNDTLGSIASTFGLTQNDIQAANNLSESSAIRAGDKLVIPTKSTAQPVPLDVKKLLQLSANPKQEPAAAAREKVAAPVHKTTPAAAEPVAQAGHEKVYVVQKGDNPVLIAKKNGIKYADLLTANKITDPKKLQIGQKLIIPQK